MVSKQSFFLILGWESAWRVMTVANVR